MTDEEALKKQDPRKGVRARDAIYHFINRSEAMELFKFEDSGITRLPAVVDLQVPIEAQGDLTNETLRARTLKRSLEDRLVSMLCTGELVAKGYAVTAPLEGRRKSIRREHWQHLKLDFETSSAKGDGVFVSGILIFDRSNKLAALAAGYPECSEKSVETWYQQRVDRLTKESNRSSRAQDRANADEHFRRKVPRAWLTHLREKHCPPEWRRGGRPKATRK